MTGRLLLAAAFALALMGAAQATTEDPMPGVYDSRQAHSDYKLKCQGCHRPDGSGDAVSNPPMNGHVARFLQVPGAASSWAGCRALPRSISTMRGSPI